MELRFLGENKRKVVTKYSTRKENTTKRGNSGDLQISALKLSAVYYQPMCIGILPRERTTRLRIKVTVTGPHTGPRIEPYSQQPYWITSRLMVQQVIQAEESCLRSEK